MATLASMMVRLGIDTDQLRDGAERAQKVLKGLGKGVGALGAGAPAVAAVTAGVGGMAAAFASAGVAAKAFQLAAGPQMADVAEAANLAEEAQKALAEGAEDAAEKQKAYKDALAQMSPATRAMAKEFVGLKNDHKKWSDSLSSSTMPVFTKGLQVVRRLLPLLTPFVKEAAKAFGSFIDEIDRGTKGKGLEKTAAGMAQLAGQNLKSLLSGLKNIAIGFGGIIKAFMPFSDTMSGGFEESTAAFAKWGQGLSKSEGFQQFVTLAKQGAETIKTLATAALKLVVALAPLLGIAAMVATALAKVINALPPGVLHALAIAIASVVIGMKAYKAGAAAVSAVSTVIRAETTRQVLAWLKLKAQSIAAMARTAAAATLNAAKTAGAWAAAAARATATWLATMIRVAAVTVARFVMMAARAVIWAATMAAQWLIAMGPVGWIIIAVIALVALIIANWDKIKAWTIAAWNAVWSWIKGVAAKIWDFFVAWSIVGLIIRHWSSIKAKTIALWTAIVTWVKGVPGRASAALSSLASRVWSRVRDAGTRMVSAIRSAIDTAVRWVKGLPGRAVSALGNLGGKLLGAGRSLVNGFIRGITGMFGAVRRQLNRLTSMLPDWKGPATLDARILTPNGALLIDGFMRGIDRQVPALRKQLAGVTSDLPGMAVAAPRGVSQAGRTRQTTHVVLDVTGADEDMKRLIRRMVRIDGRGNVQTAFGR
ncbi:hypothetical protein [Streptomyces meridianus]|uniref:Uncharacterized protein n=1 Tax=Streptomyces meridianus TaxID=2938945 RepID=A0ABT0XD52_9ACTN|nr:hypothetical protein [Streptomyces meridianus]MCM2580441.1 hypothetical protein [Streptomyces meridianus]